MEDNQPERFVGRAREMDSLRRIAQGAPLDSTTVILFVGEPGAGKTRLAQEAARVVRSDGFALVVDVVDDLHLLDADAISAVASSDGRHGRLRCATVLAGALPPGSAEREALLAVRRRPQVFEIDVVGLSRAGIIELLAAIGSDADTDDILHRSGGNPFFARELARSHDGGVPWAVRDHVSRMLPAGDSERQVVDALAVAGRPLEPRCLRSMEPGADVAHLLESRLLRQDRPDGFIELRHGVTGEMLRSQMDGHRIRDLHRLIADTLDTSGDTGNEAVWFHQHEAGDHEAARATARAIALTADDEGRAELAVRWFERAMTDDAGEDAHLLARAAVAAGTAGRVELAERWARAADNGFRSIGRTADAEKMWADRALRYIRRPGASDPERPPLAGAPEGAELAARAGDLTLARRLAEDALRNFDPVKNSDEAARAALALFMVGDVERAMVTLEHLRNAAFDAGDARLVAWRSGDLAACCAGLGDVAAGVSHERAGLTAMSEHDDDLLVPSLHVGLACLLGIAGDLESAGSVASDLAAHPSPFTGLLSRVPEMIVAISKGRHEEALDIAVELAPFKDLAGPYLFGIVLIVQAYAHFMVGDLDATTAVLDELDEWVGGVFHQTIPIRIELRLRTAAVRGDADGLGRLKRRTADLAGHVRAGPGLRGNDALASGLLAAHEGDLLVASQDHRRAAELLSRSPRLLPAGLAWCDAAALALDADRRDDARINLLQADRLIEEQGIEALRPIAERVRRRLGPTADLTTRERELMQLLAHGRTNKEIATELGLSPMTVRNQLHSLFTKLGIQRRAEAAAIAIRLDLGDRSTR